MANTPNDRDPKPVPPDDLPAVPPAPGRPDDLEDLADLADLPDDPLLRDAPPIQPLPDPADELPDVEAVGFDEPIPTADAASLSGVGVLGELPDLADLPDEVIDALPASGVNLADLPDEVVAEALPASGPKFAAPVDPEATVELTPQPPSGSSLPVAPASGWLDEPTVADLDGSAGPATHAAPLQVNAADLFGDPSGPLPRHAVESSDIFGGGPPPVVNRAESSDVIAATAYSDAERVDNPRPPERPSEVALTFDQPPGGSTVDDGGSGNLPMAEEIVEEAAEGDLFGGGLAELPFDSAQLANAPDLPGGSARHDVPDFGATPNLTPDASSILADLSDPDPTFHDESSVRLEAPGVGRTLTDDLHDGTEFDLTVSGGAFPPELEEAAAASDDPTDWREQAGSDLFADARTVPDVSLPDAGDDDPTIDEAASGASPSSIFTGGDKADEASEIPLAATPVKGESTSDSSVEFSDHPSTEDEAALSRTFRGPPSPVPSAAIRPPAPSEPEFELADVADPESIDWSVPPDDASPVGLDAPPSSVIPPGTWTIPDDQATLPTRLPRKEPKGDTSAPRRALNAPSEVGASDPSVEIDWMAGSSTEQPAIFGEEPPVAAEEVEPAAVAEAAEWEPDAPTREEAGLSAKGREKDRARAKEKEKAKTSPAKPVAADRTGTGTAEKARPERARSGKGGWVGGTLLGMVVAGGACAGVYFGGLVPNAESNTQQANRQPPTIKPDNLKNLPDLNPPAPTAADVELAIRAGDAARAKTLAAGIKEPPPAVKASLGAGQLFSLVQGAKADAPIAADNADLKTARENLQALVDDAEAAKTPEGEKAAVLAAVRVGVTHELAGDLDAARKAYEAAKAKFPKYAATLDASLERINATAPPAPAPMPDGNSRRPDPDDVRRILLAVTLLQAEPPAKEEKKDDDTEAGVFFWKAVNKAAAGDYADAVKEIEKAKAAHVKQAKALAGRGLNPLSDPLEQIFPRACDDLKAYWELRGAIYGNKAVAELFKKSGPEQALASLAKRAEDAAKLATDLKDATDKLTVATDKLKDATDLVKTLEKDVKAADEAKVAVEKKLDAEEKARKASDTLVASLAKELQAAKLLPEKFDAAELLAAQKTAADRAAGPNLTTLLSPAMMVVGGGGLSAGQLLDVAERLAKAEAGARAAADKLVAETKRLAAEHADATTKLKDAQALELKKAADKAADDAKKQADDFAAKVKDLEAAVAKEKETRDAQAAQFKKDLGNAMSPAQALDLWLPLLVELRRPADADPALATAEKALAAAAPNSEDAAKARTVAGLASLYKNELAVAKMQFQAAKGSPAYEPAAKAKKLWALAADVGLDSVSDPLAPFRRPPELPKRDPVVAARFLDAGVKAYKEGRYADAITALTDSTKADPAGAVAWYFLGASRWASGSTDAARDDFRQGAVREGESIVPTRVVNAALSPIQGPARDALTAARP